jgi:hypothetical protein
MPQLVLDDPNAVSFPDCKLCGFICNSNHCQFVAEAICVEGRGLLEKTALVSIHGWEFAEVVRYDSEGKNPHRNVKVDDAGSLDEICECRMTKSEIFLAGFEKHAGTWQTYTFRGAAISITISE